MAIKNEDTDPNINNIVGTNKITRNGRIFSPEISPKNIATTLVTHVATPTITPVVIPATELAKNRGKEILVSLPGRRHLKKPFLKPPNEK